MRHQLALKKSQMSHEEKHTYNNKKRHHMVLKRSQEILEKEKNENILAPYNNFNIPNPETVFLNFENQPLKSQLLWYYNSGLHRFSNIDKLPSNIYEKKFVKEIKQEIPTFEEKQKMIDDYT